jgi:hypothetical protein
MAKTKKQQLAELKKTLETLHNTTFQLGQLDNAHGLGRQIDQAEKALDEATKDVAKLVASCSKLHAAWNKTVDADTAALAFYIENLDSADAQKKQAVTEQNREAAQKAYEVEKAALEARDAQRAKIAAELAKLIAEDDANTQKMIAVNKQKDVVEAQISKLLKEIAAEDEAAAKTLMGRFKKLIS